jgi:hypothetical protein
MKIGLLIAALIGCLLIIGFAIELSPSRWCTKG